MAGDLPHFLEHQGDRVARSSVGLVSIYPRHNALQQYSPLRSDEAQAKARNEI
jgi:hypothetical protein